MKDKEKQSLLEDAIEILRKSVSGFPFKTQAELSRASGESEANISRWLSGASTPTLRRLEPVLMALGVRFALPDEDTRPLRQTEVHAAKSMLNRVDSWKILKDKANLRQTIMLRMPIQDLSMQPTINPGDIVMIDTTLKSPKEKTVCLIEHTD
ncbi:MAG: helix-turn-helix domain-containing protein, partial [Desulfovibrio sp.]|nr:helix-turn-helix domain-containing protein [Desulfovibrio sp.]